MLGVTASRDRTLVEIASALSAERGSFSKPHEFYEAYELYFSPLKDRPVSVLEIGVFEGESTKVFSRYFDQGRIIGLDLETKPIDFSGFSNVIYRQANQTSAIDLGDVLDEFAPEGVDIIVDDASHIGWFSKITFDHIFHRLNPGGLYIVEDWCTGYWKDWPDGRLYERRTIGPEGEHIPYRIQSHSIGMVGFLKSLVDMVGSAEIAVGAPVPHDTRPPIEFLHVYPGTAVLKKARTGTQPIQYVEL